MAKAAHSENPRMRRMAGLAKTLKRMPHKADGGSIDDSIDISGPGQGPYSLSQAMTGERAVKDREEIDQGKRFYDTGTRIPGQQKAKNDRYMERLNKRN
jgi:hypothetical protein